MLNRIIEIPDITRGQFKMLTASERSELIEHVRQSLINAPDTVIIQAARDANDRTKAYCERYGLILYTGKEARQ